MADAKLMVNPNYTKNQKKIEQEEKELEELMAKAKKPVPVEEEDEEQAPEVTLDSKEEELSVEEKTFKKRYGDLRRHMSQKEKEWEEKFEALKKQTTSVVPPKSDEDIEQWAKKYPDVAGIVETIAQKKAKELFATAEKRFEELDRMQYETVRKSAEQQIREAHSDFDDLRDSDAFHDWANEQPKWVQDALYENEDDPRSVIRVIDLYKVDKGMTPSAKKAANKDAAKMVRVNSKVEVDPAEGTRKIRESEVAKMSDKEYEKRESEILAAMKSGNFIYDISGGAR